MNSIKLYLKILMEERLRLGRGQLTLQEDRIVRMRHTLQSVVSETRRLGNVFSEIDRIRQSFVIPRSGIP